VKNPLSREFQVFVKPVGAECNLRCRYCYYLDKADLYNQSGLLRMTDEILEKYIILHLEASTEPDISFSWHGGEPTLAGLDFFRQVVNLQKKLRPSGRNIINGIQTNATFLNDNWCKFLASEGFFVGVSIDGPEELHNKFRVSKNKAGSFRKTLNGFELLKKHNIPTEILTVVNAENVNFPHEVYRFLKQLGSKYMTFLPLVEREPGSHSGASSISVAAEAFGSFLSTIFDEWVNVDIGNIKIQIIEEAARTAFNQEHTLCIFKKTCGGVPVVEHNGDFYSCDHYADKEHLIGNINKKSLIELLETDEQQAFGLAKLITLPEFCLECEVRDMCNGECPKNRFIKSPFGEPGLNYLCPGYKRFFSHVRPFVKAIAEKWNDKKKE
jgi:uncharacterized protein